MNIIYAIGSVLFAIGAACLTAWLLHRYSRLGPARREDVRWYATWRRVVVVATAAFFLGALNRQDVVWALVTCWACSFTLILHYTDIGVRPWGLLIEQSLLWIAWMMGGIALGASPGKIGPATLIGWTIGATTCHLALRSLRREG